MPTWEARVSRGTAPAERVDGELRYAFAAPLVREAGLWIDLGCGTGVAAGAAWDGEPPGAHAVLVDRDGDALAEAQRECGIAAASIVEADLGTAEGVAAVREAMSAVGAAGPVVVTCFGVIHQLADVTALVELLTGFAGEGATVVLSIPDDDGGAIDDPHRRSAWSASGAEELRRLLGGDVVALRQVAVRASAIVPAEEAQLALGSVDVPGDAVATHHLLAFGPGAERLVSASRARAADARAERADARRRESDLAYLEARVAQLER
jgi:SAM-dependent methyltransferase